MSVSGDGDPRIALVNRNKALLASIAALEAEVKALRGAHKEHKRSGYITALQSHLHDRELVIDVLKAGWAEASGKSVADINEYVVRKSVGGPKRFRPKTREEMALELQALSAQHEVVRDKIRSIDTSALEAKKVDRAGSKLSANAAFQVEQALRPVREQVAQLEQAVEARQAQIRDLQMQV
jgi:hypothetical protein